MIPAGAEQFAQPRGQRGDAVRKGEEVHIGVRAGVAAIYQPGLWRNGNLIEQCAASAGGKTVGLFVPKISVYEHGDAGLKLLHGVCAFSIAELGVLSADKTAPLRERR